MGLLGFSQHAVMIMIKMKYVDSVVVVDPPTSHRSRTGSVFCLLSQDCYWMDGCVQQTKADENDVFQGTRHNSSVA